ncbi:hypothetical protein AM571_PC01779 (plasmid) [Rhizobium etli 8C-3]|uniref:Uncharacterized protein n=1 Tax=Rhizobium etli 8C-3 TaxID=538025 RepID=A0A1L5PHJ8_RHIET|nr:MULTISPECIES: hypothetical protein [Rhizobium]APO79510.1 hypothetical protein AM571_PC01779 [Rhizobium etli 8C-3]
MRDKSARQQGRRVTALIDNIPVERAAATARSIYGDCAKTAVAWCAIHARSDERSGDFAFWVRVFRHLGNDG